MCIETEVKNYRQQKGNAMRVKLKTGKERHKHEEELLNGRYVWEERRKEGLVRNGRNQYMGGSNRLKENKYKMKIKKRKQTKLRIGITDWKISVEGQKS